MQRSRSTTLGVAVAIGVLTAASSWGQVIMGDLVLHLDANTDTDGADGWDFTQPAVNSVTGTLALVNGGAVPTNLQHPSGGRFFRATGVNQGFAGETAGVNVSHFTYELWLRVNGNPFTSQNAIAGWRQFALLDLNYCRVSMSGPGNADADSLDLDMRDICCGADPTREIVPDIVDLGDGEWHQVALAYLDAGGETASNGILNVYLDGDPTPVTTVTNLNIENSGGMFFAGKLDYATAFLHSTGEASKNFNGDIAIIRLYRRVLSPMEITQNFDAQRTLYSIGPEPPVPHVPTNLVDLVELQFETTSGLVYRLDRSIDITASPAWEETDTFILGDGGIMRTYDTPGTNNLFFNRMCVGEP